MTSIIAAIALATVLTIATEPGATFDGPTCWEADGTEGMSTYYGQCVTPADYDALFSYANLSTIPSAHDPSTSIAEEAGLVDDGPASERILGVGVAVPFTFAGDVHSLHWPKAI